MYKSASRTCQTVKKCVYLILTGQRFGNSTPWSSQNPKILCLDNFRMDEKRRKVSMDHSQKVRMEESKIDFNFGQLSHLAVELGKTVRWLFQGGISRKQCVLQHNSLRTTLKESHVAFLNFWFVLRILCIISLVVSYCRNEVESECGL
jgi:hypothetical protein